MEGNRKISECDKCLCCQRANEGGMADMTVFVDDVLFTGNGQKDEFGI